ncbi:MAG TPA: YbaK/EbsC family protein [Thermoanaerobaculia bacterium]|nr:YbaK/EbsC family protein [Thermoanaerobaculia bacterium]
MSEKSPEDLAIEARVRAALEAVADSFEVLPCDPALADTAAFCAHYGVDPSESANTIVVASKKEPKRYAACLVLATTRLDVNHAVRALLDNAKLSFASGEETSALTGMTMGGVTVFGLPPDLPVFIDSAVLSARTVVVGGGSRSMKIRLAPEALSRIPNARVIEGLAR